jgi:exopolysaccharide biosynthesis polyprenyl glycosylphosphotransferase
VHVTGRSVVTGTRAADRVAARLTAQGHASWMNRYLHEAAAIDGLCALAAGLLAFSVRFNDHRQPHAVYLTLSLSLPVLWILMLLLFGGYDSRFVGVGSDEFRRVLNVGLGFAAAIAIIAYATKTDLARGYVLVALPTVTIFDLLARLAQRKRLHRQRRLGRCMRRTVVVGHAQVAGDLATQLRRDSYHGLDVVAACVTGMPALGEIAGVPVIGDLGSVPEVVQRFGADTVAVLACPEMSGVRLRELAWALEKTGTDLCVAPALLDVAGPRTRIRPVAGLPLLHMDHPEFTGGRRVIKSAFDKALALSALALTAPAFALISLAIWISDGGSPIFPQIRVGLDGRPFTVYKFRTMVPDAERRKAELATRNENDGLLFKIRDDPRVTLVGAWLRRWSLDELPQLFNVLIGDMSLVGPRPALPEEAAAYGDQVRRRLVVKPGMTGLWQVNGRSDLSWEESVRLDLRYVENWSLTLDMQILWKTLSAVLRGSGAY